MREKLRDARGETLVEVLASILVGALSVALLFTAVAASARMDEAARKADETYSESLIKAEAQTAAITDINIVPAGAQVTVYGKKADGTDTSRPLDTTKITFYGGEGAISYALNP